MPKVALIFPYFRTKSSTEMLFPPLGAASLSAQLSQRHIETRIFDCTFQTFSQGGERPDCLPSGYCRHLVDDLVEPRIPSASLSSCASSLPEALLVVGGPMPTLYPERYAGRIRPGFPG